MLRTNDKDCVVQLRLSKADKDRLTAYAKVFHMSCSEYIRQALHIAFGCENNTIEQIRPVLDTLFDNLIDSLKKETKNGN